MSTGIDSFNQRVAKLTVTQNLGTNLPGTDSNEINVSIVINVAASLAMMIIDQELIEDTALIPGVVNNPPLLDNVKVGIKDGNEGDRYVDDRFVLMSTPNMPITKNTIRLYYDRVYNDILILPDLRFFDNNPPLLGSVNIMAQRLGDMSIYRGVYFNPSLAADPKHAVKLPEVKGMIDTTIYHNVIPGYYNRSGNNNDVQSEHQLASGPNLYRWEGSPVTILKLGKFSDIFKDTADKRLPLFTIYQKSPEKYDMLQLALGDPKENDIYVMLRT